ncbi:MAG: cytochrome c [Acidobacteriales bacterium]|nr:cytochrome c [Terriglobales bacterium]
MQRMSKLLPAVLLLGIATACNQGRHSPSGFRLPAGGNVERGKAVFLELQCHSCHEVPGTDVPRPTVQPPVPVRLGGEVAKELTDGYLVTSIINPSHKLARFAKASITVGGKSRMPDYADRVTARQLTDLVSYLHSNYTVRRPMGDYLRY